MNEPAGFCMQCGAALQPAARFCTRCGASRPAQAAGPVYGTAPASVQRSGRMGRVIVLAIAALMLAFGVWLFWESGKPIPQFDQAKYDARVLEAVQKKLQQALSSPESVTKLELNGGKLTHLPEEFPRLQNLRELAIHDNGTLDFASTLAMLSKIPALERLDLAETDLQVLPAEIGGLSNLRELLLWNNELKTLPEAIGNLGRLEWINLAQNQIEGLPSGMAKLGGLTHLDLSQNGLKSVPHVVFALPALKSLDLGKNYDLPAIPAEISGLKGLEFLGLAFNAELKRLPPELAQLQKLQEISGMDAGFLHAPETAELQRALKGTRISGKAEEKLLNQMQRSEIKGAEIEKQREAQKKSGRLIR